LSIRFLKDELLSRVGIAPPDYSRWFGPRQVEVVDPGMADIIRAQNRAGRIRERGVLVDELLKENATRFERKSPRPK
jgi:hypothetical protein